MVTIEKGTAIPFLVKRDKDGSRRPEVPGTCWSVVSAAKMTDNGGSNTSWTARKLTVGCSANSTDGSKELRCNSRLAQSIRASIDARKSYPKMTSAAQSGSTVNKIT